MVTSGSVLVKDNTVVMGESNRVQTETDIRRHPELHLVHRACRGYDSAERTGMVMYTSTEPCPMCAGGMAKADFGRVVYSIESDKISTFTGSKPTVRCAEILDGVTDVVGPLLNKEGRQIHEDYDW